MPITLERADYPPPDLRRSYLASLPEPQELYLEDRVARAATYRIRDDGELAGYAAVALDGTLVEFHVANRLLSGIEPAFDAVVSESGAARALCKSFDTQLLFVALRRPATQPATVRVDGLLFRRIVSDGAPPRADLQARLGTADDIDSILAINEGFSGDGFFDYAEEIASYLRPPNLLFVFSKDGETVGCGIVKQVVPKVNAFDIGMLVAKDHRRRGYATHIVATLKRHCLANGMRPICGCAADNVASRRTLERAGFVTEHAVLEIGW